MSDEWDVEKGCYGVRVKYEGNVLYCGSHRTTRENRDACYRALAILLDESEASIVKLAADPDECLTVELYRSSGAGVVSS